VFQHAGVRHLIQRNVAGRALGTYGDRNMLGDAYLATSEISDVIVAWQRQTAPALCEA
jgi:hypothetical protein